MTYVALTALVALAVVVLAYGGIIRWLIREQRREREALQNKLMHLAGRTWEPPPVGEPEAVEVPVFALADDSPDPLLYE